MKNIVSSVITNSGTINLVTQGKMHIINKDHMRYKDILDAVKSGKSDILLSLIDVNTALKKKMEKVFKTKVELKNGVVVYKDQPIHNSCTKRIIELWKKDLPFMPMVKFLDNLLNNPSKVSIDETYRFLEFNNLPITEDGCFLAVKRVRADFKDFYTGLIDNSVGKRPQMDRKEVDDDCNRTCSKGLHFCSKEYLKHYHAGEGVIILVKVNPKDVVSIPTDYQNTKGRCCEYTVLMKIENDIDIPVILEKPLYKSNGHDIDEGEIIPDDIQSPSGNYHNVRDSKGRFVKKSVDIPVNKNYNVRDSMGRFTKNGATFIFSNDKNISVYSFKPNGQKYHSFRNSNGKFAKKN